MALMRRGALFAGALFAGVLFGPAAQEAIHAPGIESSAFSAPRPRAHIVTLRAAGASIESERAKAAATHVLLLSARGLDAENAHAGARIAQLANAIALGSVAASHALAASRLDTARVAALDDEALACGLL